MRSGDCTACNRDSSITADTASGGKGVCVICRA
jgi:hypothetical protein